MPVRSEVSVKMIVTRSAMLLAAACFLVAGCNRSSAAKAPATAATQTIAPAAAPSSPDGPDAMTQTVNVEDSRSEAEGGSLNSTQTASSGTATTTVSKAARKASPKPPKKKK
jgi:uncharacterized lipoprotein YajG